MTNREMYEENQKKIKALQDENKRLRREMEVKKDVPDDVRNYALEKGFGVSEVRYFDSISRVIRNHCYGKETFIRNDYGMIITESKVTSKYGYKPFVVLRTKKTKELTDAQFEEYKKIFKTIIDVLAECKTETESIAVFLKENPHFFKEEEKVKFKKYLEEMERENEVRT